MNEELTKELIAILRAMKDGAPDAWRVLVEQRSTYCLTMAGGDAFLTFLGLIAFVVGLVMFTRPRFWDDEWEPKSPAVILSAVVGLVGLLVLGVNVQDSIAHFAEGMAPLGRILEAIR